MTKTIFKEQLFKQCVRLLQQRISIAEKAMREAQDAANNEEKSSMGDKYETGRAMNQLSRDMNAKQLAEAQTELSRLMNLDIEITYDYVIPGSMIKTNRGIYFIATGLGTLEVDGEKVIALSAKSPLASVMKDKRIGDRFSFHGNEFEINSIN